MKKSNSINHVTENLQTALDNINTLARKATAGTLKRIYCGGKPTITTNGKINYNLGSSNDNIRKLRNALQADFNAIDNNIQGYIISDAYDLYMAAYSYLHEQIIVNGLTDQTPITHTLKNGKEKTRTVYQWACVLVRKEVYANKSIENTSKYTYIEDLKQSDTDTAETALDREYIRMGKYNGISTNADYDNYTEMLTTLNLTPAQKAIVKMRMQGLSLTAIAEKLNVTPQTLNTHMKRIRERTKEQYPEKIKLFSLEKHSR